MTFTLKDIKHLDVMANLVNATPVPTKEINIKELLASDTIREVGVNEKILSLCSKLRSEGFDKQAEGLESKFLAYKSAAVHLYNTHNETGEDLINAAHPDGDNAICDAADGLGTVETVLSRHKKMVDVITKEPKGKLASRSASKLIKKADVVIAEIGKKFKYMADYIQTNALTNVPEGDSLKPEQRRFYAAASLWHQAATLIATELNSPASLPEREVVQLVKNRLQNDPSVVINQHAGQVNSIADIDQLISNVLSRVTDKNPNKFASKLLTYVGDCAEILKNAQIGWVAGPIGAGAEAIYKIWQSLKSVFGDVADSAEIMRDAVAEFLKDKDIQRFTALKQMLQNTTLPNLNIAISSSQLVKDLELNTKNKLPQITQYKDFYTALQSHIVELKAEIEKDQALFKAQQSASSKAYNAVYNVFIISNANKVKGAATALYSVLADALLLLGQAETDSQTAGAVGPTQTNTLLKPLFNGGTEGATSQTADAGIAQLNGFLAMASEPQKQKWEPWIQQQIKKFKDNANNPDKIKALLAENEVVKTRMGLK